MRAPKYRSANFLLETEIPPRCGASRRHHNRSGSVGRRDGHRAAQALYLSYDRLRRRTPVARARSLPHLRLRAGRRRKPTESASAPNCIPGIRTSRSPAADRGCERNSHNFGEPGNLHRYCILVRATPLWASKRATRSNLHTGKV
jgi:hypothetical protein